MCCRRIRGITNKPHNPPRAEPVPEDTVFCQEECYYMHGEIDEKYCTECIRDHLNQSEPFYMVYYHASAIGYMPHNLEWSDCYVLLTTRRPIADCRLCLVHARTDEQGIREVRIDEEILPVSEAARVASNNTN